MKLSMLLSVLIAGVLALSSANAEVANPIQVVDLRSQSDDVALAVRATAGLLNRNISTVFTLFGSHDAIWLQELLSSETQQQVAPLDFLNNSLVSTAGSSFTGGKVILYDRTAVDLLPSVLTMAAVLESVPLSLELYAEVSSWGALNVTMNTTGMWSRPEDAVKYTHTAALAETTSLAFHPGRDIVYGDLADWIMAKKLFVQFLNNSCIPLTEHNAIFRAIVHDSPWPRPVRVYGYNSQDMFLGGDLFEAETDCVNSMGQIATTRATNLAFWQHYKPFDATLPRGSPRGPLVQPPSTHIPYDPSKKYVALVYGDMDNINFVQTFGMDHMRYRSEVCANESSSASTSVGNSTNNKCFPLSWTLSPNLVEFSPEMMRWYFNRSTASQGRDWFVMPPSGTLYAYPGMMTPEVQSLFVEQQNAQAYIMDTHGSVHWEWFFEWAPAFNNYFPRYINSTNGTNVFLLNDVPWVVPIPPMLDEGDYYKIIGDPAVDSPPVVAFRPAFNWEPTGVGGLALNATQCAEFINLFQAGSVQYIYIIQNSDITSVFDMVAQLADDVVLVGYGQLASLALQRSKQRKP